MTNYDGYVIKHKDGDSYTITKLGLDLYEIKNSKTNWKYTFVEKEIKNIVDNTKYYTVMSKPTEEQKTFPKKWSLAPNAKELKELFKELRKVIKMQPSLSGEGKSFYYNYDGEQLKYTNNNNRPLYEVVTIEQLKNYYLKQTTMERKIIGYKAPMDLYKGDIKKDDILSCDDWNNPYAYWKINGKVNKEICIPLEYAKTWEPVYEEEYKKGDYIYVIDTGNQYTTHSEIKDKYPRYAYGKDVPTVVRFVEFISIFNCNKVMIVEDELGNIYAIAHSTTKDEEAVRKATPEEIKAAQTIEIAGYKAEFNNVQNTVRFGCSLFNKETVEDMLSFMENVATVKLSVGGYEITKGILRNILSKF